VKERVGITLQQTNIEIKVIETIAIAHGETYDQAMERVMYESDTANKAYNKLHKVDPKIPNIETDIEFDIRFKKAIHYDIKKYMPSDNEILILKEAYYYYKMSKSAIVPQPTPHDKKRYKKYKNAIDTIEEMLTISKYVDSETLLEQLKQTYNVLIQSKADIKKMYIQKMNEKLSTLKYSKYTNTNIIETFKNTL